MSAPDYKEIERVHAAVAVDPAKLLCHNCWIEFAGEQFGKFKFCPMCRAKGSLKKTNVTRKPSGG